MSKNVFKKSLPLLLSLAILPSCGNTINHDSTTVLDSENTEKKLVISGAEHLGVREYINLTCSFGGKIVSPKWASSDNSIATVSSVGMVKGMKIGTCEILASYNGETASFTINVTDSWALSSVVTRLRNSSYHLSVTGDGGEYDSMVDPHFEMDVYQNSFYFNSPNAQDYVADYGCAMTSDGMYFSYSKENNAVKDAVYFRDQGIALSSRYYGLSILSGNYYTADLDYENTYDMSNSTYLKALYFLIGTQFVNNNHTEYMTELKGSILSLVFTVNSEKSFTAVMGFGDEELGTITTITMKFDALDTSSDPVINEYLKTKNPEYPEVYSDITNLYELSKNHNYTRDLGNYTKGDGSKIHIGNVYYTEDYYFCEYNSEYIEETKDTIQYTSKGVIDIYGKTEVKDGCYNFTIVDGEVVLGERDKTTLGFFYDHWYDYCENLTLILDTLYDDFYSFDSVSTGEINYPEYGSYCDTAASLTSEIFNEYVSAIDGLTSAGMLLAIDYNEKDPNNSLCNIGGLFTYNSQVAYQYSKYPYSKFNKTSSKLIDDYLASLK